MRSLNDDFFKSMKINNPEKIHGGTTVMTCLLTRENNHSIHDGDIEDSEQIPIP